MFFPYLFVQWWLTILRQLITWHLSGGNRNSTVIASIPSAALISIRQHEVSTEPRKQFENSLISTSFICKSFTAKTRRRGQKIITLYSVTYCFSKYSPTCWLSLGFLFLIRNFQVQFQTEHEDRISPLKSTPKSDVFLRFRALCSC